MWVKICGTTNLDDARVAVEAGADALGFVFAESPRRVTAEQAREIVSELGQSSRQGQAVEKIGVFVDADFDGIVNAVLTAGLTGVQIHGDGDEGLAVRLRERFAGQERLRILQVLHFWAGADVWEHALDDKLAVLGRNGAVDAVLVDSRTAQARGGTGIRFDWEAARRSFVDAPWLRMVVAGGLGPENVGDAIATLDPWGVDVVSGVEAAPGRKDAAKVRAFVENARAAALQVRKAAGV